MKKSIFYLMMMVLSFNFVPATMMAAVTPNIVTTIPDPKEVPAEVKTLLNRLDEIKAMDKSNMTRVEKRALRKEVKAIKAELKSSGNGVYLSVGAIIIIVLLLILLL
ncbi:MAG: hypothetical protein PSV16_06855 [Flavobacterium sp.]|nr:hypothetical protein [Flavobacterium sp.]